MSRGGNDRGRPYRGGRFRGGGGRGRGGPNRGRGRGGGAFEHAGQDEFDYPIQQWSNPDELLHHLAGNAGNQRGGARGRGRGAVASPAYANSGASTPRRGDYAPRGGRGRGDGGYDRNSPRGGRGRGDGGYDRNSLRGGRGRGGPKLGRDAPLSNLWNEERPFLKPIIFVPSVHTRILFEEEEDLVKPQVLNTEDTEASHVPTADRISRIFSGGNIPRQEDSESEDDADEVADMLEEIDFEDMARMREVVDAAAMVVEVKSTTILDVDTNMLLQDTSAIEERFTGILINLPVPSAALEENNMRNHIDQNTSTTALPVFYFDTQPSFDNTGLNSTPVPMHDQQSTGFYIDTTPSAPQRGAYAAHHPSRSALGAVDDEDDEVIVYVAPHPRTRDIVQAARESAPSPQLSNTSMLTGTTSTLTKTLAAAQSEAAQAHTGLEPESSTAAAEIDTETASAARISIPPAPDFSSISKFTFDSPAKRQQPRARPAFTPRDRARAQTKARRKEARAARLKLERRDMFGSFGAIMSEAQLRDGDGPDPKWEERRRGDSDVEWGDTDEDINAGDGNRGVEVDEISNGMGGMELDGDLELDAMKAFVKGMSANGGRHVTMDDIADAERMQQEDEAMEGHVDGDSGSEEDGGEAQVLFEEEEMMIGETQGIDISDDSDSDLDQSPTTGFRGRLERMRKNSRGKKVVDADRSSDDESEDDYFDGPTRGEEDDDFIAHLEAILDEKGGVISDADRKARNRLFRAVHNGDFSDSDEDMLPAKRNKNKAIPANLQDQWDKDRAHKAEIKVLRAQARIDAAADALTPKKGGKKGRKAMRAAAKFDPDIEVPNRVTDMFTVEQQIRRFLENLGGKQTMVLPPMEKESRKQVHELAIAFNLKSASKGKGSGRYTTLSKTTRSGMGINEGKIRRIVKRGGGGSFMSPVFAGGAGRGGGTAPRHKEGDEVGKAAPKIGQSNLGFKMLALMGWSEGERIGTSGLDAPLTAVIKNTKLGLGAGK
ncbi:hypothetical protein FIBSPDRAFT_928685 [Athelia psychrophila]|uniref:Protein SQS1 n=1 Tax=Athelia psychrophila TaxID=1759441 RepID=A0A166PX68_9AGAM|nr:hypothetical protein FIBSPDRAFT_928685 [Fibularhizoctonia sp. CBS 109695]